MWSDPSLNMAYGNQWMNPALYQHMNNEQVDWASLAQQWIKMKETSHTLQPGLHVRPVVCEINTEAPCQPQGPSKTFNNHNTVVNSVAGNNIEKPSAWNTWTWQQQQQWNWNWNPNTTPLPPKPPIMETVTSVRPPYIAPPVLPKPETYAVNNSNRNFNTNSYWAGSSNTRVPHSTESEQWNKPNLVATIDDKNQDSAYIDAAKRKQLPAWIREGLEKMEREKRRKIEQEQSNSESEFQSYNDENTSIELHNSSIHYDSETVMVDEEIEPDPSEVNADEELRKTDFVKSESPSLIPRKSKAQIWEDTMLSLRQILTKLLMDVTNDMMLNVAKEMLKTTLHTGLGDYGSASESSGESDDENTISSRKPSNKQDSDEAIQERLLKRQREFSNTEARILMELDKLEDREKLVRSKFDSSVKLSGDVNDTGSQVVENVQTKGRTNSEGLNPKVNNKGNDKSKPEWSGETSVKNGSRKKKSKSKRSSSSDSSSDSESSKSEDTDSKIYSKKSDKYRSRSSNKKSKAVVRKRSRSRSRSRSYTRSKRSRSRSRRRSSSRSRRNDRKSTSSYRSKRSRSPLSKHGSSRKHRSKRDSSSSSSGSRSTKHRYRR